MLILGKKCEYYFQENKKVRKSIATFKPHVQEKMTHRENQLTQIAPYWLIHTVWCVTWIIIFVIQITMHCTAK